MKPSSGKYIAIAVELQAIFTVQCSIFIMVIRYTSTYEFFVSTEFLHNNIHVNKFLVIFLLKDYFFQCLQFTLCVRHVKKSSMPSQTTV
jgi:hypothetical protein